MFGITISSVRDNLRQKATNPYLGTLIIVWCIENWKLLYGLFNFDSDCKQTEKISYVLQYFNENPFIYGLKDCIWISFVVLIGTYIAINLSRIIVNFFDKTITPAIYSIWKGSVVLASTHEEVLKENDDLLKKIKQDREDKLNLQNERDLFEKQIRELTGNNITLSEQINELKNNLIVEKPIAKRVSIDEIADKQEIKRTVTDIITKIGHPILRDLFKSIDDKISIDLENKAIISLTDLGLIKLVDEKYMQIGTSYKRMGLYEYTNLGKLIVDSYKGKY